MGFQRPDSSEHHEYYGRYVALVPEGDILEILSGEMEETQALLASVPPDKETHAYAPGKWTVREVVGHLIDAERLFGFRALWFARRDQSPQPAMDQDAWAGSSNAAHRPLADLAAEWTALRRAHVMMFAGFAEEAATRTGVASGYTFTVRALAYIISGHEIHHRRLLRRDYLGEDA